MPITHLSNFEKQGIATEACRLLTELSLKTDPTIQIIARSLMEDNASTKVLKKNDYKIEGVVTDPEDGEVWEWRFINNKLDRRVKLTVCKSNKFRTKIKIR